MIMRRSKRAKKAEELADGSDADEESPQPIKKGNGKKKIMSNLSQKPSTSSAAGLVPPRAAKKEKAKAFIKNLIPKKEESDSEEKPAIKKKKIKGGKVAKIPVPVAESSDDSDLDSDSNEEASSPTKVQKENLTAAPKVLSEEEEAAKNKYALECMGIEQPKSDDESEPEVDAAQHKEDLDHLSRVDPDFYDFLKQHDSELLHFDEEDINIIPNDEDYLDEQSDREGRNGDGGDSGNEDKLHVPGELHGDSDESDFEEDGKPLEGNVTLKLVKELEAELLKEKVHLSSITKAMELFAAAVQRVTSADGNVSGTFKVRGSSVFNAILNMVVVCLPSAIGKYLGIEESGKDPKKCKHFVKMKKILVHYFIDLAALLGRISSVSIKVTMLKHLHQVSKYIACFTRVSKTVVRRCLNLWGDDDETVRVLAFMCILRITRNNQAKMLEPVLRAMFFTYIRESSFVSPAKWPGINFMRRSLVEMYSLDLDISYRLVFLYIRQLGIILRNAIVVPSKEHRQRVFNWQYINALHLWAELVPQNIQHKDMKTLNFPLSMIVSNVIKLGPTPQHYPTRFLMIELLMKMEDASGQFIPILPFLVDVLSKYDINMKHKKASMKPLDFSSIIKVSKSQMAESGFKDAVVDRLYALLLEYMAAMSYRMVFPDCTVVLILFLKMMVDKCNNSNHKKKLKQLHDKIVEGVEYIKQKRFSFNGNLAVLEPILAWERQNKAQGTPLLTFYENWSKLNKIQKRKSDTKNDELAAVLPLIKRPKIADGVPKKQLDYDPNNDGPVNLFPSDSEDDDDLFKDDSNTEVAVTVAKAKKKKQKKVKKLTSRSKHEVDENVEVADGGDVVSEFSW